MKLIEYKGADLLPKKKELNALRNLQAKGFNDAVSQVEKVGIRIDEGKIIEVLKESIMQFMIKTNGGLSAGICIVEDSGLRKSAKHIISRQKEWLSLEVVG